MRTEHVNEVAKRSRMVAAEMVRTGMFRPERHGLKLVHGVSLAEIVEAAGAFKKQCAADGQGSEAIGLLGIELGRRLEVAE